MQVTQYGLQDCYKRAYNAIVEANLAQMGVTMANATPSQLQNANAQAQNAVLSQAYLRLEQPIVASQNTILFPILNNQTSGGSGAIRPTEVRLSQQDSFFCSNISIYLAKAASTTDVAFKLETYPNSVSFALGGAVTGNSAPLFTFYNGYLVITINKSVIVPNYPVNNFLQIPQTQLTAATNSPETQFDPSQVSLWEPNINFVGTKSSNISIVMPAGILNAALDANTYAVIILQGILAQNVTLMS